MDETDPLAQRQIAADDLLVDDPLVGQMVEGRYRIRSLLGEGGMGRVYRVEHVRLRKALALKVLRSEVSRDEEIMVRFQQEAQSASAIGNEHIVDVSDFGTLPDGSKFFVMELLDGPSLADVIEDEAPLDVDRIVLIGRQLCRALGAAHSAGIVHRDLKPDNIVLIERAGNADFVKVLDFGVAKVSGSGSTITRAGQVFGTPDYMSPEQCTGARVDLRTDIYALGVMLYEMATGRRPFVAEQVLGVLTQHLTAAPVPPSEVESSVPSALEAVILRAMAKLPDERYPTTEAMLADLDQLRTTGSVSSSTTDQRRREAWRQGASRRRPFLLGAAFVAVALLAAGGMAVWQELGKPAPVPTIRVVSDPEAAEVWRGEQLLGITPLSLALPPKGEEHELRLRKRGHVDRAVVLTSEMLGPDVHFTLDKERRKKKEGGIDRLLNDADKELRKVF